jgi:Na+/melibiose symporter-like transporter
LGVTRYRKKTLIKTVFVLLTPMVTALFVKENYQPPKTEDTGFFGGIVSILVGLKKTFSNSAFVAVLIIYLMCGVVTNFLQGNMVLFVLTVTTTVTKNIFRLNMFYSPKLIFHI